MARQGTSVKQAAEILGVQPKRVGSKRNGRFVLSDAEIDMLRSLTTADAAGTESSALARIERLEADRANLLAQVAWARAIAQEQQKALEFERERAEKIVAELGTQRERIEQLKALSAVDRLLGRHKRI
jgi:hypothetical protein